MGPRDQLGSAASGVPGSVPRREALKTEFKMPRRLLGAAYKLQKGDNNSLP